MSTFTIDSSKENIDLELYRMSSLPTTELMHGIKKGVVFVGRADSRPAAICIMEKRGETFEILHWAVLPEYQKMGYGKEIMLYALDYINVMGGRYVETGAPNTDIQMFVRLQRMGFRVTEVRRNYYPGDGETDIKINNGIKELDMLRYRIDLKELLENIKLLEVD